MGGRITAHSCSTFILAPPGRFLVGYNLDSDTPTPGLVFINKRGVWKHNIGWLDLSVGRLIRLPRIEWVAKQASLTCNAFGKEFPDAGLNEAGLFVGALTLFGTVYPPQDDRPEIYHFQWIQYLLDNFTTVAQVLENSGRVRIAGNCELHFFIADAGGQSAVIEFLQGKAVVYTGEDMPVKALCNNAYASDLAALRQHFGFGGKKPIDYQDRQNDLRFIQAAGMLRPTAVSETAVDLAFEILKRLDCGNNQWKLVFDIPARRMYYRTALADTVRANNIRTVSLYDFDLTRFAPAMMADIHAEEGGDTAGSFIPFDQKSNHELIREAWMACGPWNWVNRLFRPLIIKRMSDYPKSFD